MLQKRPFYRAIGGWLAVRRRELNMTQERVANEIGIPRLGYLRSEAGDRCLSAWELWRLSKVLKFNPTTLFKELEAEG